MLAASGYPGMKIMQFAFDRREPGNYLPYTYPAQQRGLHRHARQRHHRGLAADCQPPRMWHYACRYLRCTPEAPSLRP